MVSEVTRESDSLLRCGVRKVEAALADQRGSLLRQRDRQDVQQRSLPRDRHRAGGVGQAVSENAPHGRHPGRPDQRARILELLCAPDRLWHELRGADVVARQLGRDTAQRSHAEAIGLAARLDRRGAPADGRDLGDVAGKHRPLGRFGQQLERERPVFARIGTLEQDGDGVAKVAGSRLDHAAQMQELRPLPACRAAESASVERELLGISAHRCPRAPHAFGGGAGGSNKRAGHNICR
jgi:hypothetical protein